MMGLTLIKVKIDLIDNLSPSTYVKDIRSFLQHVGFYRFFIQDFNKVVEPLIDLLAKDVSFPFSKKCLKAFNSSRKF